MEWHDLLHDTWQTGLVFIALFGFTRLLGKTQVGQLTFYEYISGITIGSIAGNIVAAEPDKYISNFYDLLIFLALTYFLSYITLKNRTVRNIVEGDATILIANGLINKKNMQSVRLDLEELTSQLRSQGVLDIATVQYAVLEPSGTLSVIKKINQQPVSKADIELTPPELTYPIELIMDGMIIDTNLKKNNISRAWLQRELTLQGIKSAETVLYGVLDSQGKLFISPQSPPNK